MKWNMEDVNNLKFCKPFNSTGVDLIPGAELTLERFRRTLDSAQEILSSSWGHQLFGTSITLVQRREGIDRDSRHSDSGRVVR